MILLEMPNITYPVFEAIRDEILAKNPWALINDIYTNKNIAYLFFWDVKFVPNELMKYALNLPSKDVYDFSHINLPKE